MLINGRNSVREAIRSNVSVNKVFVQQDIQGAENLGLIKELKSKNINIIFLPKKAMDNKVSGKHQGFIADIEEFKYANLNEVIDDVKSSGKQLFIVILDGIEDPHNFGSIIRSCECAGVHMIIISSHEACPVNATVVRVSAGAVNHMPIVKVGNLNTTIKQLKKMGIWVYGCELGGTSMYDVNLRGDIAIVIGSEGKGIKRLTRELCDEVFTIPMYGKVNSLNASNAAAISLYEAIRQRMR